jgi:rSAM/selenodomain-associated transferase 1
MGKTAEPLAHLLVIAKSPLPGHAKTRLCPPCTPEQAAALAEAALADTLEAAAETSCDGRTLVLDGPCGDWLPAGFEVVAQGGGALGDRLAAAFSGRSEPALLIGMDTPQVDSHLLGEALAELERPGTDAVLGLAEDGGYWAIGLRAPDPAAFEGVPMSSSRTGTCQRDRLRRLGMTVRDLPRLRDVDEMEDARSVAAERPLGRFARTLAALEPSLA